MENQNKPDAAESLSAVYNNVKRLYEEVKLMWKGVLFEIQLDPLDPESEEQSARHTIDFRYCLLNEDDDDRQPTLEELFTEIERLHDSKSLFDSALQAIDFIQEEYKHTYQVTFLRILQFPQGEQNEVEIESESEETMSEEELESDEEFVPEWEQEWVTDSGNGSVSQYSQEASEYNSTWASDSGLQTELESEIEVEPEWELGQLFDVDHEFQPEHQLAEFFGLNSDTDSDDEVSTTGATCNDSEDERNEVYEEEANL